MEEAADDKTDDTENIKKSSADHRCDGVHTIGEGTDMTDRISWCKTVFLIIAVCMGLVSRAESTPVKENTAGLTETMTAR